MEPESPTEEIAGEESPNSERPSLPQEPDRLAALLVEAEQRLAAVPDLELRIADLEYELAQARRDVAAAREEAKQLDQMLMYGRRMLRFVRPFIKPLRDLRRRLRS